MVLRDGRRIHAQAVVITTGTFLNGLIHCGEQSYPAGRSGEPPSVLLGENLKKLGLRGCRLKTGTPPRLDGRTIDWSQFKVQPGDPCPTPFSFRTRRVAHHDAQVPCYLAYTTAETHRIIRANVHRSPMYSGQIQSIGPALLPVDRGQGRPLRRQDSASDFPRARGSRHPRDLLQRHQHQPAADVQEAIVRSIPGLEHARDAAPRLRHRVRLDRSDASWSARWRRRRSRGLFLAGQINGTSGYEEAAARD